MVEYAADHQVVKQGMCAGLGLWLVVMGGRTSDVGWFRTKTDTFLNDVVVMDRYDYARKHLHVLLAMVPYLASIIRPCSGTSSIALEIMIKHFCSLTWPVLATFKTSDLIEVLSIFES